MMQTNIYIYIYMDIYVGHKVPISGRMPLQISLVLGPNFLKLQSRTP